MANLAAWQKVSRVLGGDWGDGKDGSATISADPNTRATYTGTADSTSGTAGSSDFADGDLVKIIQFQGTGAGQWEYNMVASGGGSTSLVMKKTNHFTYGTGAQIIKVPRYTTATINAHSVTAWNGTVGGIEVILAKTSVVTGGALNGAALGQIGGTLRRGWWYNPAGSTNKYGESGLRGDGSGGAKDTAQTAANGTGAGGSSYQLDKNPYGGGGGANAAAGSDGGTPGSDAGGTKGSGGTVVTSDDLVTLLPGGSGGSGAATNNGTYPTSYSLGAAGGNGGAVVEIISKSITLSHAINLNGGNSPGGANEHGAGGGGGAGGSCLLICDTATIGTNQISVAAGGGSTGANSAGNGGNGSVGRIAIHHSGTVTGTTAPTFIDVTDASLHDIILGNSARFYFM